MKRRILLLVTAIVLLGGAGYGAYQANKSSQPSPTTSSRPTSNQSGASSGSSTDRPANTRTYRVTVYFSKHPQSDGQPEQAFAVARTSPTSGVGRYAINQLLLGPTAAESSQGYFSTAKLRTATSSCAGADFKLSIQNKVATLQFCKPFDHLGVVADGQAESEIKATLLQFSTVTKVIILNAHGDCEFNLSGQNLCKQ